MSTPSKINGHNAWPSPAERRAKEEVATGRAIHEFIEALMEATGGNVISATASWTPTRRNARPTAWTELAMANHSEVYDE